MKAPTRALVLDDIDSWVYTLTRAARRAGASEIITCSTVDEVREELRKARFDIAILDIGLDPNDDQDADGVKALELIRQADGEGTRCVLVTGWQGGDRLSLQADLAERYGVEWAYMKEKYEAGALIAKLTTLLDQSAERRITATTPMANLNGTVEPYLFEDRLLKKLNPTGGVTTLYHLVARLLAPCMPLVAQDAQNPLGGGEDQTLLGLYWSRALRTAVAVEFGRAGQNEDDTERADEVRARLGVPDRPELLMQLTQRNVWGALWELPGVDRQNVDDFRP